MCRIGVFVLLSVIFSVTLAGFEYGFPQQRIKRSPGYYNDCPPYYQPRHHWHQSWPPEYGSSNYGRSYWPRPPFPPPGPPSSPPGSPPPPSGPPYQSSGPPNQSSGHPSDNTFNQGQYEARGDAQSQQLTEQKGVGQGEANDQQPNCDECSKGQDTAISNAKSVSGSAVAIAISGKNSS